MTKYALFSLFSVLLMLSNLFAEDKKEKPPADGVLSQSVTTGYQNKSVDLPWGYDKDASKSESPITGSVSKVSDREWTMRVFNNSKDTYSVDLKVSQYDKRGTSLKSDNFSYTLKGGSTITRSVSTSSNTADAQLKLVNWKNLSDRQREKDKAATDAAEAAEALRGGGVQPGAAKKK